jgi:hypothetical protein
MLISLRTLALAAVVTAMSVPASWAGDGSSSGVRRLPAVESSTSQRPSSRRVKTVGNTDSAVKPASAQEVEIPADAPPAPIDYGTPMAAPLPDDAIMMPSTTSGPVPVPAPTRVISSTTHGHAGCSSGSCGKCKEPGLLDRIKYKWTHYWKPELQESHWGYPEEFCEKPLGYFVYAHNRTMVANGEAARMMLYHYDFVRNEVELTSRGQQQLAKIAYMLPRNYFPLAIQSTPEDPGLAERRRQYVLELLAAAEFPVPAERVVVTGPISYGRQGYEGEPSQALMLQILTSGDTQSPFRTVDQETSNFGE